MALNVDAVLLKITQVTGDVLPQYWRHGWFQPVISVLQSSAGGGFQTGVLTKCSPNMLQFLQETNHVGFSRNQTWKKIILKWYHCLWIHHDVCIYIYIVQLLYNYCIWLYMVTPQPIIGVYIYTLTYSYNHIHSSIAVTTCVPPPAPPRTESHLV